MGPISRREVAERLAAGSLSPSDHFWFDGMGDWVALGDHPAVTEVPAAQAPATRDDQLDLVFGRLVKSSWDYYEAHNFAVRIDEVFLGALITSSVEAGWALIDLESDGTHHYLRFEEAKTQHRLVVQLTHLTTSLTHAKVLGHRARVVVGYGERVKNFGTVWRAVKAEYKSGYIRSPEPGTMTVDGDMASGYIYVQVDLYFKIDDYVREDYAVDYGTLSEHLTACTHALRKYLRGRFKS